MQIFTTIYTERKMTKSRTIFIWDVHGCYDELKLLLKKLNIQKEDKVFFTWDMINKWPKSFKVIKLLYKNKEQFKCVKWNSEVDFLEWLDWKSKIKDNRFIELNNKIKEKWPKKYIKYIRDLPLFIDDRKFTLLHWGIIPNIDLKNHNANQITRLTEYNWKPWYNYYAWTKKIIYWHWAKDWLQTNNKTIWLDTWCVYWKALTAHILETGDFIQQTALNIYINPYVIKKSIFQKLQYCDIEKKGSLV